VPDKSLFRSLTDAIKESFAADIPSIPPPPDSAAVRTALAKLEQETARIESASNLKNWLAGVSDWQSELTNLAMTAYGDAGGLDDIFARALQAKLPRIAALFATAGVMTYDGADLSNLRVEVDWNKLGELLNDPGTAIKNLASSLLRNIDIDDLEREAFKRLPAVFAALILLAPRTILALVNGNLKIAGLPDLGDGFDNPLWKNFFHASDNWIGVTVPIGDPTKPRPVPASAFDFYNNIVPDFSATLGIRSNRRVKGSGVVTDIEFWIALLALTEANGLKELSEWEYDFGNKWVLRVRPGITFGFGYDGVQESWHGAFRAFALSLPIDPNEPVVVTFSREPDPGAPDFLFGPPYDTRLQITDFTAFLELREETPIFEIGFKLSGLKVVIAPRYLRKLGVTNEALPEGIQLRVDDLELAYQQGKGLRLRASAGLDTLLVLNLELGNKNVNLTLHSIRFSLIIDASDDHFFPRLVVRFHISGTFGPLLVVLNGMGVEIGFTRFLRPSSVIGIVTGIIHNLLAWSYDLLPPTGYGYQLTHEVITAGGFWDFDTGPPERAAGVLYGKLFKKISVTIFGTSQQTPEGHESVMMALGVRFSPGFQLGYGFTLTGLGGLIGINRRVDTDALRERLVSGAIGSILIAEDPIKNAPRILGDLQTLFPAQSGVYVFGPTAEIVWNEIATFNVAIIIELPGPSKIVLMGVARILLGLKTNPLVDIRIDLSGIVDFSRKKVEFDATLIKSKLMQTFDVTGDAALRMSYGSNPYAMLTIGGFHPAFNPEPAIFPKLTRLAITHVAENGADIIMRLEAYLAITSNTIQVGANIQVQIIAGSINAVGAIGFDALIQFSPFYFSITFSASFRIKFRGRKLAGIKVSGTISGPGPIVLSGKFCFEILFFDICWKGSFKIGSDAREIANKVDSLLDELAKELAKLDNLRTAIPDDLVVLAARGLDEPKDLIAPALELIWTQNLAPLDTMVDRVGGAPLNATEAVIFVNRMLSAVTSLSKVKDYFSPGSFIKLSNSEALNRTAFEPLPAGISLNFGLRTSGVHSIPVQADVFRLPIVVPPHPANATTFPASLLNLAAGRIAPTSVTLTQPVIAVTDESWTVRNSAGNITMLATSETDAHQRARVTGAVALPEGDVIQLGGL
jgi:hypothetical protein